MTGTITNDNIHDHVRHLLRKPVPTLVGKPH
jgi:hypothetical protein